MRSEVTQLGGRVEVSGAPGQGTEFKVVLPLTLAVIPIMLVSSAGRNWAIPAAMVEEARQAHEMLGKGGVLGKIVLLPNG